MIRKKPVVFIPFLNERDDMGRIIKNADPSIYKVEEETGNLIVPKISSLTQANHY